MKSLKEFIDSMVTVEFIEVSNCYGHYPFQLLAETKDGILEINALALGGNVAACYDRFVDYKNEGANRIYMSLDFPRGGDINTDFVAVFSLENGEIKLQALPYSLLDGKILDPITESKHLNDIMAQLKKNIK